MSALDGIKQKIAAIFAPIKAKFGFLSKKDKEGEEEVKKEPALNVLKLYEEGNRFTKILIIFFGIALLAGGVGTIRFAQYMYKRNNFQMKDLQGTEKFDAMSKMLKEEARRVRESASTVSLGRIRMGTVDAHHTKGSIALNIWVRCSEPETAKFIQDQYPIFHDVVISALEPIDPDMILSEAGKDIARKKTIEAMNKIIRKGKVLEAYFHSLVLQ